MPKGKLIEGQFQIIGDVLNIQIRLGPVVLKEASEVKTALEHIVVPNIVDVSPRAHQVLQGIIEGKSNLEIGHSLGITERTVKFHVSNLLNQFKVKKREELKWRVIRMVEKKV
jgi:DNA-binding NarL/FixJ family response regulator